MKTAPISALAGALMALFILTPTSASADQNIDQRITEQQHVNPAQSIDAAYKTSARRRFLTLNYTSMICTTPGFSVIANMITSGVPVYGQPLDNQWLEKQKSVKNCWQQPPNAAFYTTDAIAVDIRDAGVVWVTAAVLPKSGKIAGFIPIEDIQPVPEF